MPGCEAIRKMPREEKGSKIQSLLLVQYFFRLLSRPIIAKAKSRVNKSSAFKNGAA
jgi:hypothetical protein